MARRRETLEAQTSALEVYASKGRLERSEDGEAGCCCWRENHEQSVERHGEDDEGLRYSIAENFQERDGYERREDNGAGLKAQVGEEVGVWKGEVIELSVGAKGAADQRRNGR
jgi:hypothetical protein